MHWPKSLPDYQWPRPYSSAWMAPLRGLLSLAFHSGYAIGRLASPLRRGRRPILIIRTDGIGDAVLFEPALETLAQAASPRAVHLWAPRTTLDVLGACPVVDRRFAIPRGFKPGNLAYFRSPLWRMRMGWRMGFCRFEKVIYPADSPEPLGNWLYASVRATERWINYGDTENQFEWQRQRSQKKANFVIEKRPGSAHELLRNAYLATQWSGKLKIRKPKVHISERARSHAASQSARWKARARVLDANEIVAVIPAGSSAVKRYPIERWVSALATLWTERRALPALIGAAGDIMLLDRLAVALRRQGVPLLRMDRPLSLLGAAALLKQLDGVISVDTGLAHLAVAQTVPSVVLVGGYHPGRFFPWPRAEHHVVLNVQQPCDGCRGRCSQAEPFCITQITAEDIVAAYKTVKRDKSQEQLFPAWTSPLQATA